MKERFVTDGSEPVRGAHPDAAPTARPFRRRAGEVTIQFYGGVGVIGGTKIVIATPRARVLLDLGLDIPAGADLFRAPVTARPGYELADLLNTGCAPDLPGIYDPAMLPDRGPRAGAIADLAVPDRRPAAIFVSHAHVDHDGMLGFVRADVPCYAHPRTIDIHQALARTGLGPAGNPVRLRACVEHERVRVGDLAVEAIPVDHDVPGACGFLVHTPAGRIAYTGDINFHRNGGRNTHRFMQQVHGATVLITETTMLSFDPLPQEPCSEAEIGARISAHLTEHPGTLQLISLYPRDLDRAGAVIELAAETGRRLVWPGQQAAFLSRLGVPGVVTWAQDRPQLPVHREAVQAAEADLGPLETVQLTEVEHAPGNYLIQIDHHDLPALLDLPMGEHTRWIHSQGEPLGPFVPEWAVFTEWLDRLGIVPVEASSSGHAGPSALTHLVREVDADTVYPVHGFRPEALADALAGARSRVILPRLGERYPLCAQP